jgi:hypothetical protein
MAGFITSLLKGEYLWNDFNREIEEVLKTGCC